MKQRLMKMRQVATILGVSEDRAYVMAREGLLPIVRMGRQVRVDKRALEEWINAGGRRVRQKSDRT